MITKPIEVTALKADGTTVPSEPGKGCKLPSTGNWYFDVSVPDGATASVHLIWDAALAATINLQDTNAPQFKRPSDADSGTDVALNDETAGNWMTEDASTAYVPVIGTGNSVANMTITAGGTHAGAAMYSLGNLGTRRQRIMVAVTTAGTIRVLAHGKG